METLTEININDVFSEEKKQLTSTNSMIVREQKKNEWKSCCFILDKRCLLFLVQVIITILTMLFSMYKLIVSDECSPDRQVFSSILTMCLSIWLPAPKIGK